MDDRLPRHRITDLAAEQRPPEGLAAWGAEQLSDTELVAILVGSGTAARTRCGRRGGLPGLRRIPFDELRRVQGIGLARAATMKAAAALAESMAHTTEARPVLSSLQDVADQLHDLANAESEHLRVVLLDARDRPIRKLDVNQGSVNTSLLGSDRCSATRFGPTLPSSSWRTTIRAGTRPPDLRTERSRDRWLRRGDCWRSKSSTRSSSARRGSWSSRRRASASDVGAGPRAWPETCTSR